MRDSPQVLVCRLAGGRVTYVHRRVWPALVKLASRFRKAQLVKVWDEHTRTGAHRSRKTAFPAWVPSNGCPDTIRVGDEYVECMDSAAGYESGGGAFNNPKGRLLSLGVIEYPDRGTARAAAFLFL